MVAKWMDADDIILVVTEKKYSPTRMLYFYTHYFIDLYTITRKEIIIA